jgi:hypothetical protein
VERRPSGSADVEEPERALDVRDGPDDPVPRLGEVAAGERDDLDERGPRGKEPELARVDLASDPIGSRAGAQTAAGELLSGEN